jgi:RNA polymerase sigma-70 factor, ECF subfamily
LSIVLYGRVRVKGRFPLFVSNRRAHLSLPFARRGRARPDHDPSEILAQLHEMAYTHRVSHPPTPPPGAAASAHLQTPPPTPPPMTEADIRELALVRRIQGGGDGVQAAWAELLTPYQDRLFGVCVKMLGNRDMAADVTQDAMVKIIEGLGSFDGRSKLSTWMIRVTMNVCLSKLRSEKLRRHISLDALNTYAADSPPTRGGSGGGGGGAGGGGYYEDRPRGTSGKAGSAPHGRKEETAPRNQEPEGQVRIEREENRRRVTAGLLRVSPEQRAILVLRDARGLDYEQIAEVLDVPVGTVKSRLFRARAALREAIEALDGLIGR